MLHISTRGEYGVRVMIDLARHFDQGLRSLTEISDDEGLPVQYLEQLIKRLRDKDLVASVRGAHGGYQLTRAPQDIRMSEVLQALEGSLETYSCPSDKDDQKLTCDWGHRIDDCTTRMLWGRLRTAIVQTLEGITLAELSAVPAHPMLKSIVAGGASA